MKIAIAGCGPAGLSIAIMLTEQGYDVTVFERFESPRPVGSGIILQPTGLAVLEDLGVDADIHALGHRIDRIHGVTMPSRRQVLNVDYSVLGDDYHGLAVHRAALFEVLYRRAEAAGIDLLTNVDIEDAKPSIREISLVDRNGQSFGPFDLVIDASGAGSKLRRHAIHRAPTRELAYGALWGAFDWPDGDFEINTLKQRYVGAHTMIGVLPIGTHSAVTADQVAFFWSIKSQDHGRWLQEGLEKWKSTVLAIWPETGVILDQINDASDMALARYGHSTLRTPYGQRIVFLGDAAHSTSPQLGQGANMALLDAWSLSKALQQSDDVDQILTTYAASRRWHVRAFQWSSLALTPFYQSDSRLLATLRDWFFDPVAKLPIARRIVAGLISGKLAGPPRGLLDKG